MANQLPLSYQSGCSFRTLLPTVLQDATSTCIAGDLRSIPGLGRFPGEENGYLLQYCLKNPTDRGVWWATVHGVAKVRQEGATNTFTFHL